jgi:hypothetical protein
MGAICRDFMISALKLRFLLINFISLEIAGAGYAFLYFSAADFDTFLSVFN